MPPINPADVKKAKIPDEVFTVFNELIQQSFGRRGEQAVVLQDDVVAHLVTRFSHKRETIFDMGWLNVEDAYRAVGWVVEYDRPSMYDDYPATFTFKKPVIPVPEYR